MILDKIVGDDKLSATGVAVAIRVDLLLTRAFLYKFTYMIF